jgi:hypothetical protein
MTPIERLVLNIWVVIGSVILLALIAAAIIGIWTGLKILVFHTRRKLAEEEQRRRKFQPDGRPYPPAAPGICSDCQLVSDSVFHLPDGRRLCAKCYRVVAEGGQQEIRAERP